MGRKTFSLLLQTPNSQLSLGINPVLFRSRKESGSNEEEQRPHRNAAAAVVANRDTTTSSNSLFPLHVGLQLFLSTRHIDDEEDAATRNDVVVADCARVHGKESRCAAVGHNIASRCYIYLDIHPIPPPPPSPL